MKARDEKIEELEKQVKSMHSTLLPLKSAVFPIPRFLSRLS